MQKFKFMRRALLLTFLVIGLFPAIAWLTANAEMNATQNETIAFVGVSVIPMDK